MTLRLANANDLPRLVDLWMEMMHDHHKFEPRMVLSSVAATAYRNYLQLHLGNPKSLLVLAEENHEIHAYCCAYVCRNLPMFAPAEFGYISDLAVTPSHQRKGLGTQLLEHSKEWFRGLGVDCLQLQVYSNNESGKRFWKAKGFTTFVERHSMAL